VYAWIVHTVSSSADSFNALKAGNKRNEAIRGRGLTDFRGTTEPALYNLTTNHVRACHWTSRSTSGAKPDEGPRIVNHPA
jgi:hypothetical protein